nr:metalloregulator ArsR/SmtB family transcription factor [Shouchella shacheensis]
MVATANLTSAEVAQCLKVLSDPTRLLILKLVQKKEYCVCQFVEMFEISQPAVSQHIRKLKQTELLKEVRRGQWRFYSLDPSSKHYQVVVDVLNYIDGDDEQLKELLMKETPVICN